VEPLVAQGAKAVASVGDACRGDAIVTMLANDEAVASVTLGEGGIIASLPKGAIHISSSTISVALSEALSKAHGDVGQCFVAAPVFGRPELAAAGQLFVVAAGAPAARLTAQSVTEIAFTVGFCEASSFTAAFRRETGRTPSSYRRSFV
jgi:3-hydroxyisobutyrate dehydrogenase-like beta-hydroxyacid dehydrogenase